jgi:hypothetical protein
VPCAVPIGAVGLELLPATPAEPKTGMACADSGLKPVGQAGLAQQGLDARIPCLARTVLRKDSSLEQVHAQPALEAGDCRRGARWPAARDDHIGIESPGCQVRRRFRMTSRPSVKAGFPRVRPTRITLKSALLSRGVFHNAENQMKRDASVYVANCRAMAKPCRWTGCLAGAQQSWEDGEIGRLSPLQEPGVASEGSKIARHRSHGRWRRRSCSACQVRRSKD